MINRFIRNFLNGQHIICKVQQIQAVRVAFLHHCNKNVCPAAVLSCGACMASSSSSSNRPSNRSELLDAYRNKRAANLQLTDLGQDAVAFALDPLGSRFIQQKLERANPTEKAQFMDALRGHMVTLSQQVYGNHVIRKTLESVDKASQIEIINEISAQVTTLSLHEYGNWVIRYVLEHCTEQQKRPVLEQLLENVPTLVMDKYGNFVIQHVLDHERPEDRERIVRSLHEKVLNLVTDQYGCYVIQHVIEHGLPEDRARIVRSLQANVPTLVTDKYGTFVIEHLIEHGLPEDRERIVRSLQGDIMKYAQDKFGSLVMRKCFVCGTADQKKALFDNVCVGGPQTLQNVRQLMADEFGHYVIEKFFEYGTEDQKAQLVDALRGHVLELALQMHGSYVIQTALKSVDKASQIEIIEELTPRSCVIRCIKDQYGMHVMNTIFELVEPQRLQFVVDAILSSPSDSVASLSLHECGYRVIQRMLEHCTEQQKRYVLEQLRDIVPTLIMDKYGSFVIQHVIEHGRPEDRERIVRSLQGDILKTHYKSICSIIEKCLIFGTTEQKNALIDQVCADDGTGKTPLLQMMKKQFANDVVVKMVDGADSAHRDKMMFAIEEHIPALLRLKKQELEQQSRLSKGAGVAIADKRKKPNNG
uniref:PUM-HD domain-containing protein n=1 Tax=Globodera rostochiensis TaxID=31243 RepID=A0A914IFP7_GLORO